MDSLRLENIKLFGHCGVSAEEQLVGAQFEIDVEVFWRVENGAGHDNEFPAIDYTILYEHVRRSFQGGSYKLVENAAAVIAESILKDFEKSAEVQVHLRKLPPFEASMDHIEVRVTRQR